ncbi:MAG TPA: DUF1549 domain-containing protein [Pirellulaceae bacterium]|nr:DUF1549 domain-containing protein [Pirellulaceae bacterium]
MSFFGATRSRSVAFVATAIFALLTGAAAALHAEEASLDDLTVAQLIDREIAAKLGEAQVTPAPTIDDVAFVRRVTLDLAGRIPTARETEEFLASETTHRRETYVDRLLQMPDYAVHLRNELDLLLLAKVRRDDDWRNYLLEATAENRSWDKIVRDILVPEKNRPGQKGPAAFLRERTADIDKLTSDVSATMFGVNISCAKCHDHPLVLDWQQDHYYGLSSFFSRTYRTSEGGVAERFEGMPKFTTTYGEEKVGQFMFLTGAEAAEPELTLSDEEKKQIAEAIRKAEHESGAIAPTPEFSPRAALVDLALADADEPMLARNIVNRTWARLIGRGIVEPLDQFHSYNPPSHPELLEGLTATFIASGYNLKSLIRGIVLSQPYARSCEVPEGTEPPAPELFAVGVVRALTPRQMATSLDVATMAPDRLPGMSLPPSWEHDRRSMDDAATELSEQFAIPDAAFQVGVDESLLFSNGSRIEQDLLRDDSARLLGSLKQIPDDRAAVEQAFLAILSRWPALEERETAAAFLADRSDRRDDAMRQLAWALLATAEFRFNH